MSGWRAWRRQAEQLAEAGLSGTRSLKPILPLSRKHHIRREGGVRNGVGEDAIPEVALAHHPPVIDNSGEQAHIPERAVLRGEQHGGQPECHRGVGAQRDAFEVFGIDQPAHQPAAPEELFEDGNGDYTDGNTEEQENRIVFGGGRSVACGLSDDGVVERDGVTPGRREHVRAHPEHEDGEPQQDAEQRGGGPSAEGFPGDCGNGGYDDEETNGCGDGKELLQGNQRDEDGEGKDPCRGGMGEEEWASQSLIIDYADVW